MRGRRLAIAAAGLLAAGAVALPAQAQPLAALTAHDVTLYAQAFAAAERGDVSAADQAVAQVDDSCLKGEVQYLELTHARARSATFDELNRWLKAFGDLPGATQLYELALKLHPADALPPPAATSVLAADIAIRMRPAPQSRPAREAYFDGDVRRALQLARASGDAWIAGLAAYRLGQYADAMVAFETLAANDSEDDPTRAAGGFWAARSAVFAGLPDRATPLLKIAAAKADTFYGMIAKRKLELIDDPLGRLIDAASSVQAATPLAATVSAGSGESPLDRLVRTDPRAHRAIALAQLSRQADAGAELRAGFAEATDDATRALWLNLTFELGPTRPPTGEIVLSASAPVSGTYAAYPVPNLAPAGGFTVDKALVYAVVWQESRFNSLAVSPVGAVGLMQLMPPSAASVSGDATLTGDPIHLFDTGRNLQLGQAYIRWLEENAGNHDLLRTIAAYNGGPTTLVRTENLLGPNADSLLVIESVPFAETRAYVRKVVAAYWSYRRQFGAPAKTLDAAASDLINVDARLDEPEAPSAPVENAQGPAAAPRQPLEIVLHRNG